MPGTYRRQCRLMSALEADAGSPAVRTANKVETSQKLGRIYVSPSVEDERERYP